MRLVDMPPSHCEASRRSQSGNTRSFATSAPRIPGPSPVQGWSQITTRDDSDSSAKSDPAAETRKAVAWWLANNANSETAPGLLHSNIFRSAMLENEDNRPNKPTTSIFQHYTELVTIPESSETEGQDDPYARLCVKMSTRELPSVHRKRPPPQFEGSKEFESRRLGFEMDRSAYQGLSGAPRRSSSHRASKIATAVKDWWKPPRPVHGSGKKSIGSKALGCDVHNNIELSKRNQSREARKTSMRKVVREITDGLHSGGHIVGRHLPVDLRRNVHNAVRELKWKFPALDTKNCPGCFQDDVAEDEKRLCEVPSGGIRRSR
ncbi:hypothetical protein LTR66_005699 [Elasticomyces elasticus]|nr:hypothetical protein LTR66_005699 [Elasticomyces elasticus]